MFSVSNIDYLISILDKLTEPTGLLIASLLSVNDSKKKDKSEKSVLNSRLSNDRQCLLNIVPPKEFGILRLWYEYKPLDFSSQYP